MRSGLSHLHLLVLWLLASCSGPLPRPIDPVRTESEFLARSLADAGLQAYIKNQDRAVLTSFPPASWGITALTLVAFYFHPELDDARARLQEVRAAVRTAGAWPNPVLDTDLGRLLSPEHGVSPWIYAFDLRLSVSELWKRGHRIEAAEHLGEAARLELAEVGWCVRSRVRSALANHLLALRSLELRRTEESLRSEIASMAERKLAVGEVFRLDVDVAKADLSRARAARAADETSFAESRVDLAAALGLPTAAIEGITFAWPNLEEPPPEEALSLIPTRTAGLLNRLDIRRLLAEYEAAEAALRLEVAKRYPDLRVGPSYEFEEGEGRFLVGLSLTLPILDQNQGPIAEALARRREVGARFRALQARAIAEMEAALVTYRGARVELEEADLEVASVERRERAIRRAMELGAADRSALVAVSLEGVTAARNHLDALRRAQQALGELEEAVQKPLGRPLLLCSPPRSRNEGENP